MAQNVFQPIPDANAELARSQPSLKQIPPQMSYPKVQHDSFPQLNSNFPNSDLTHPCVPNNQRIAPDYNQSFIEPKQATEVQWGRYGHYGYGGYPYYGGYGYGYPMYYGGGYGYPMYYGGGYGYPMYYGGYGGYPYGGFGYGLGMGMSLGMMGCGWGGWSWSWSWC